MSEIHGAVGSYVVNALDASELDEFEAHLAVCPTCTREVVEFCETAAELSLLAGVTAPPPSLRTDILAAIKEVRPLPPEKPLARAVQVPMGPAPVDELALRRQRRRTRVLSALVAAALVVALGLGGVVFSLVQQQQSQVTQSRLETELLSAPDVRVVATPAQNGGQVSFVVSDQLNRAMIVGSNLPDAGPDRAYQLWTITGTDPPVPDNQLQGGATTKQFFRGAVADATALAMTIEQAGAPPTTPTLPILAVAEV
jgi:anti-sigma-K factor RskA